MEQMGLFVTLTTFLVGLLSIFIGNNGQVSINEKIEYVIALGLILVVFVCVGYFVVRGKSSSIKSGVFGFLLGISSVSIMFICKTPNNCEVKKKREYYKQIKKPDNKIVPNQTAIMPQKTKRYDKYRGIYN